MQTGREAVLSIAGYDPSAGAGVLADVKTLEEHGVYGCAVCTAITWQNDIRFEGMEWVKPDLIIKQLKVLVPRFDISVVKIGLIQDLELLHRLTVVLHELIRGVKLIWDPILQASAGYDFHTDLNEGQLKAVLKKIYLLTPNRDEALQLLKAGSSEAAASQIAEYCNVLLKGGHATYHADDVMYLKNGERHIISGERIENREKHGTGCILSSAIAAGLHKGKNLQGACIEAKAYVRAFMQSSDERTGFHKGAIKEPYVHIA